MYHRNIFESSSKVFGNLRKSSDIFRNFRKFTENARECSSGLRNNFGKSSEIFRKWSEIFGKSSKTPSSVSLYNKQNNTWSLGDMEFIFSCSHSISYSKINSIYIPYISARPCLILYFLATYTVTGLLESKIEVNC